MEIIPVIDLLHGQVVHARFGQRHHYQPIQSSLCGSSTAIEIVSALLELYPFERLYIADLAAIQGQNNHFHIVKSIKNRFPQLEIWLDSGICKKSDLEARKELAVYHVIGSENIRSMYTMNNLKNALGEEFVLSLDFNAEGFLGAAELLDAPEYWPNKIIAMTLYKVGSQQGVDTQLLELLMYKKASRALYAAGGVRNLDDLKLISKIGATGALIASALHNQHLSSTEISYANSTL